MFRGNGIDTSSLVIVAVGDAVTYSGPTAFISTQFGGMDTFTVLATTNLYGGFFWDANSRLDNPIGFRDVDVGSQSTFITYSGSPDSSGLPGANPPVVGSGITAGLGASAGNFSRAYDFSIEVKPAPLSAVP
ncbi:MAG: hypothetical protein IAF94_07235 [Pirellulaceae bacterium]|nr:hypothetical protein [Pirellulaceae bacterium]